MLSERWSVLSQRCEGVANCLRDAPARLLTLLIQPPGVASGGHCPLELSTHLNPFLLDFGGSGHIASGKRVVFLRLQRLQRFQGTPARVGIHDLVSVVPLRGTTQR